MTNLQEIEALQDALAILKAARIELVGGSTILYLKVDRAFKYLDQQIADKLVEDPDEDEEAEEDWLDEANRNYNRDIANSIGRYR